MEGEADNDPLHQSLYQSAKHLTYPILIRPLSHTPDEESPRERDLSRPIA